MNKLLFILIVCFSLNGFGQSPDSLRIDKYEENVLNKGDSLLNLGENRKALKLYSNIIKKYPKNAKFYFERGYVKNLMAKYPSAKLDLKKALSLTDVAIKNDSINPENYVLRGKARLELKLPDKKLILGDFIKAVELNPLSADYYFELAVFYSSQKMYGDAITNYSISVDLKPEAIGSYYLRGVAKNKYGDTEGACEDWMVYKEMSGGDGADRLLTNHCLEYRLKNIEKITQIVERVKATSLEDSELKNDSINATYNFFETNKSTFNNLGEGIFKLPINICRVGNINVLLKFSETGKITVLKILSGSLYPAIDNQIVKLINSSDAKIVPWEFKKTPSSFVTVVVFRFFNPVKYRGTKQIGGLITPAVIVKYDYSKYYLQDIWKTCSENESQYRLGNENYLKKDYKLAKTHFSQALKMNPNDLESNYNLGMTFLKLGNKKKGCECFERGMKVGGKDSYNQYKKNCIKQE